MIAVALSWDTVFGAERVWIDLAAFGLFALIHALANVPSPSLPVDSEARAQSFTFNKELASASMTAAGILLPLSLTALATFAAKAGTPEAALTNVFVGDAWLTLSLALSVVVLWTIGFRAHSQNVQNLYIVRLLNGLQIGALLAGIVRLLIATFEMVQHAP